MLGTDRASGRRLIYSMSVSLDGFISGPAGEIDWGAPDEELLRFHNELVRALGVYLCGRGLYEEMLPWETVGPESPDWLPPELADAGREFAEIWQALPKVVFSRSLTAVSGNARLATATLTEELESLQQQPGQDLAVGGARLAATATELGLIDEFRVFRHPVVLGGGYPFFPPLERRIDLELLESRTFGSRVVYGRYGRPAA